MTYNDIRIHDYKFQTEHDFFCRNVQSQKAKKYQISQPNYIPNAEQESTTKVTSSNSHLSLSISP